jgi:hypothetical protein
MEHDNELSSENPASDSLDGIPGIGPARKAALLAAGLTTRTAIVGAGTDEVIRITRMPRTQAERLLAALEETQNTAEVSAATETPQLELLTEAAEITDTVETAETVPAVEKTPRVEDVTVTILPLHTMIARIESAAESLMERKNAAPLKKPVARLRQFLQELPKGSGALTPKRTARIIERLETVALRFEKVQEKDSNLTPKRLKRLRDRLREDRRAVAEILARRPRRTPASKSVSGNSTK